MSAVTLPPVSTLSTPWRAPQRLQPFDRGSLLARLQQSFDDLGGLATGDQFSARLREHCDQPLSLLARWIVDGRVLSFEAGGERWLPLFQFEPDTLQLRRGVEQALAELRGVFDEVELAEWFTTPNAWLRESSPAALIASDPAAVVEAARADRFVAAG